MREKKEIDEKNIHLEEALELLEQMRAVDKEKGYRSIVQPVMQSGTRREWSVFYRYAAAIVLLISIGTFWVVIREKSNVEQLPVMQAQKITHGQTKAQLILATGENVVLDSLSMETKVIQDAGAKIQGKRGVLTYERNGEQEEMVQPAYNTLVVPRGGEYDVVLEDGTRVWLNADSRLSYPVVFSGKERRVMLEGEGYFEVARDTIRPFLVESGVQTLEVLGTAFNVCAYPEESSIYTTLERGRVAVYAGEGVPRVLVPGEQAICDVREESFVVREVDVQQIVSWRKGVFVFEDQSLEQIMMKLARWYNVTVFFRNAEAKAIIFKGSLPKYSDFETVLRVVEKSSNVKFEVQGRNVTVSV